MNRLNGLYVLDADSLDLIYGPQQRQAIERYVRPVAAPQTRNSLADHPELLADVDVLISGWGAPVIDESFLDAAPLLQAVFYGAGAIGPWATDAVWERNITVTTASSANAVPVAEFTLAMILLGLKRAWPLSKQVHSDLGIGIKEYVPGNYRRTVGLVAFGTIARALRLLLEPFDLDVITYDPFLSASEALECGVRRVSLDELFKLSDVVSLHAPLLPETQRMIRGKHFAEMKPSGVFINTARGDIVHQAELVEVARRRPDLHFVLDVVSPEPLPPDSPLITLPNVWMTPHLAGSVGQECRRMGQCMAEEVERYALGKPLRWAVSQDASAFSSHRPQAANRIAEPALNGAVR